MKIFVRAAAAALFLLSVVALIPVAGAAAKGGMPGPDDLQGLPNSGRIDAKSGQVIENLEISNPSGPCVVIAANVNQFRSDTRAALAQGAPPRQSGRAQGVLPRWPPAKLRSVRIHPMGTSVRPGHRPGCATGPAGQPHGT